ncbi:hypothetical protein AB0M11_16600 [Streptomyces sp. NPDC051987]|uniref:hypothetical protein n=1 Tax=Streptomyces sp. NPDC051987 TaxID=3155808 RepID=UPI0034402304
MPTSAPSPAGRAPSWTPPDRWQDARERLRADLAELPDPALRTEDPVPARPVRSQALAELTARVRAETEDRFLSRAAASA